MSVQVPARLLAVSLAAAACGGPGPEESSPPTSSGAGSDPPSSTQTQTPSPGPSPSASLGASASATPSGPCWDAIPAGTTVTSIAGSSSADLWAVGAGNALLHWDGSTWTASCDASPAPLTAVWSGGAGEAWAVGEQRVILRFDGSTWSREPDPSGGSAPFLRVWGASGQVFVLARDEVLRHDGQGWSRTGADEMVTLGFDFGPFHDLSGSGPDDAWIGADRGTLHWDGQRWSISLAAPMTDLVQSIWAAGPGEAWAVGADLDHGGGFAWHETPDGWRPLTGTAFPALAAVRGASATRFFAASDRSVLVWTGDGFDDLAAPATPTGAPLALADDDVYVPDAAGIAHWDGKGWSRALTLPGR